MKHQVNTVTRNYTVVNTNSVVRNTYILLSLSLLFSAFTAFVSMKSNTPIGPGLTILIYFGLLMLTNALRNSALGILAVFALTGFLGYTLGPILNIYMQSSKGQEIIASAFGATGTIFLGLSAYALVTKRDFSYLGGFLSVFALVAFIASIANLFFNIPMLDLMIASGFVLISSGLILFKTSEIINGGERNYIMATIALYVSLYNIFVSLLQIFTALSRKD